MIGISFGVVVVALLPGLIPGWALLGLAIILLLLWGRIVLQQGVGQPLKLQLCGCLMGVLYASAWGYYQLDHRLPVHSPVIDITLAGQIIKVDKQAPGYSRFIFAPDDNKALDVKRLQVAWYKPEMLLEPGQRWLLPLRIKPIRGYRNPGGFDLEARLLSDGIGAKGYIRGKAERLDEVASFSVERLRYALSARLDRLDLKQPALATLKALLLGDSSALSSSQWQLLRDTGTIHLVVISGMHIGIMCLIGFGLGYLLQVMLSFKAGLTDLRWIRGCPALILATGYALLAGFSIPTQRALVMALAFLLPLLLNRNLGVWQRYLIALTVVLLLQPLSIYQAGFWLSFTVVAGLLLVLEGAKKGWFITLLSTQWIVFVVLFPMLWFWAGTVSLIAPVVNVLAIPFLGFVLLPSLLVGLLLLPLWPSVSVLLFQLASDGLWLLLGQGVWSGGSVELSAEPDLLALMMAYLAIGLIILPGWLRLRPLAVFLLLPLLLPGESRIAEGEYQAAVLDVGQGLSVLIRTRNSVLLYDTGRGFRSGGSVALYTVLPYLKEQGISRIDHLVVSHSDGDHAGGFRDISVRLDIGRLESGSTKWLHGTSGSRCPSGTVWQQDGVTFTYIHPEHPRPLNENNRSCVLLVESTDCSLLLTGDIESSVEDQILAGYPALEVDWLVAAHHGSRFSTSRKWLAQLQPELVLISAGFQNPYGHPAVQMLARLEAFDIPWLGTPGAGAITLESAKGSCSATSFRQQKKRYWSAG